MSHAQEHVALVSLVELGRDQHDVVESDFLAAHMPFHFGGFHGCGPDGQPWAVMLQVAATSAALVGADPYWPMLDGLDRAWHYNWEATVLAHRCLDRADLVGVYAGAGVAASAIADWGFGDLMLGLLAQCCYVPLPQIVAGRTAQCAFPDLDHECRHDVFDDVFARWGSGLLAPPEPPAAQELRRLSIKELRGRALRTLGDRDEIDGLTREQLIELLSTPDWDDPWE